MNLVIALNTDVVQEARIPNSIMFAYKLSVSRYKELATTIRGTYSAATARKVYSSIHGKKQERNINLFIRDVYVYLFPELGMGIEFDLKNFQLIQSLFSAMDKKIIK